MRYQNIRAVFSLKLKTLLLLLLATPLVVQAGAVSGTEGRSLFEGYRDNHGGTFLDFTYGVAPFNFGSYDLMDQLWGSHGVRFETFLDNNLGLIGPFKVYISNYLPYNKVNTIVGSPCNACTDDGRYSYRIIFETPQRYAGVNRIWNSFTRTRFYDSGGGMLHEAAGSGFYGYEADTADTSTWVERIVITGELDGIHRQVGYTDDLFYGTVVPDKGCNFIVVPTNKGGAMTGCL